MKPYYEFYSDLDLILDQLEELKDKCNIWWCNDEPFDSGKINKSPETWYDLREAIQDVLDTIYDEPFFTSDETA